MNKRASKWLWLPGVRRLGTHEGWARERPCSCQARVLPCGHRSGASSSWPT
jgi:hypothetical protein